MAAHWSNDPYAKQWDNLGNAQAQFNVQAWDAAHQQQMNAHYAAVFQQSQVMTLDDYFQQAEKVNKEAKAIKEKEMSQRTGINDHTGLHRLFKNIRKLEMKASSNQPYMSIYMNDDSGDSYCYMDFTSGERIINEFKEYKKQKEGGKMKEIVEDIKSYIKDNKSIIYTVLLIVVLDHVFLGGKLRHKLEDMLGGALDTIKGKLDGSKK